MIVVGSNPIRRFLKKMDHMGEIMKTSEFLCPDAICSDLVSKTKEEIIAELVGLLIESGVLDKKYKK